MGRPNRYETEVKAKLVLVEGWARDGLTNEQIAHNLGIHISTLCDYQNKYPEFADVLRRSKEVVDREVENALLKAAKDGNITAQIFWLKNRKARDWRDKQEITHSGGMKLEQEQSYHITQEIISQDPGVINRIFRRETSEDSGRDLENISSKREPNGV